MFDLDYLTNSMNYKPISLENQANKSAGLKEANHNAGTEANDDQDGNLEEIDLHDEHFLPPVWSAYSTTEELEKLKRQEKDANDAARKEANHEPQYVNTNSTNLLNVVSTPVSVVGPSRALKDDEPSYPDNPSMPHLEDIYYSPSAGFLLIHPMMMKELMKNRFQMSYMGELTFFLGLQVKQKEDDFTPSSCKKDLRYLKGQPKLGLWYPKASSFDVEAYSDSDYAGVNLDRKSTTGGCQFLGRRLISWKCKKQTIVATFTIETEYVVVAHCCGQVLWIQNQLLDYGFNLMNIKIYIDNESTISIVKNPDFIPRQSTLKFDTILLEMHMRRGSSRGCYLKFLLPSKHYCCQAKVTTAKHQLMLPSFWLTTKVKTVNDEVRVQALIDERKVTIKESSIRRTLGLDDEEVLKPPPGMNLAALWHQQSSVLQQTRSLTSPVDHQLGDMSHHQDIYDNPLLTKKVFANMKRVGTAFSRVITPLFENMLVSAAEEVGQAQDDKLKDRVDRLEVENRILKEKSFKTTQVDNAAPVENMEKSFKQERMIADMDEDEEPAEVEEVLKVVKAAKVMTEEVNEEVTLPEKEVKVKAHKREGKSLQKEITKKQKMDEEAEELRSHLQIVSNNDDDVYTEATPLASKIPIKLKDRVDRLEVENRILKEKSFKTTQVDNAAPVENMEKSFKQERMIADMDEDVEEA
nr:uncharacterized mitochondrial protein AtMg00810-like [Tanacetum cinerariifolium]